MKKSSLDKIANDLDNTINQIRAIKIALIRHARDHEKVLSLAKQLDALL